MWKIKWDGRKSGAFIALWIIWIQVPISSLASTFDGDEWSEWSSWSPCSRTCDGGITQQFRRCKSPNGCHGVSIRRKMCNMQPCTEHRDYRNEQCKAFNGMDYKGRRRTWLAFEDPDNPCALTCQAEATDIIARLSQKLRDGTRCKSGTLHVCIDGRCEPVGCDLKLGSPKKVDECGVCGGDGSTCSTPVYRWEVIPTTACSTACGGGQQGVKVICRNSLTNERVDQALCNSGQKPYRMFQSCNIHPCKPVWRTGEWGTCSKKCGGGLIERKVICAQAKNGTELQVPDKLCSHSRKPTHQETCNPEPCPHWHVGPWSACSVKCGPGGVQTRNVVCRTAQNLPSSDCDPRLLPPDNRPCPESESPACPTTPTTTTSTIATSSSSSSSTTEPISSTPLAAGSLRSSSTTFPVVEPFYDEDDEDFLEELPKEHTLPLIQPYPMDNTGLFDQNAIPSEATFVEEEWGPCSQSCGEGVRRRKVVCKIFLEFSRTIASLPDKECPGPKPAEEESCFLQPCTVPPERDGEELESLADSHHAALADSNAPVIAPTYPKTISVGLPLGISHQDMTFSWKVMGYSPCSAPCLGGIQEAMIYCVRDYDQRVATPALCADKPQPDIATTRTCNDHPCPPRWNVSDFGPCSKPCGGGVMTREVNCIHEVTRGNTVIVPNNICPQPIPRTGKFCNTVNCPPYWEPGEWGRCDKPCGGGIRTRPLYCKQVIALGQIIEWSNPDGHCTEPPPADYRSCNKKSCNRTKETKQLTSTDVSSGSGESTDSPTPPTIVQKEWKKKLSLSLNKGQATVFQGVSLKLRCPTSRKSGIDPSRLVWMKDHHYVHIQANKIEVMGKSGTLKIKNATFTDSGIYTCLLNERPLSNLTLYVQPYTGPEVRGSGSSGGRKSSTNRQSLEAARPDGRSRAGGQGTNSRSGGQQQPGRETSLFADQQPGGSIPMSDGLEPSATPRPTKNIFEMPSSSSCGTRTKPQLFNLVFIDFTNLIWLVWPVQKLLNSDHDGAIGGENNNLLLDLDKERKDVLFDAHSRHWNYDDLELAGRGEEDCEMEEDEVNDLEWEDSSYKTRRRNCANSTSSSNEERANDKNSEDVSLDPFANSTEAEWRVGSWNNCSQARCFTWNTSMQHREVMCRFRNGTATLGSYCNHTRRPEDEQECYNNLCQGIWQTEPWSPCKSRCNSVGLKLRILKCVWYGSFQPAGNACRNLARPVVRKACRGSPCLKPGDDICKDRSRHCSTIRQYNLCHQTRFQLRCCHSCLSSPRSSYYGRRMMISSSRFKKKLQQKQQPTSSSSTTQVAITSAGDRHLSDDSVI